MVFLPSVDPWVVVVTREDPPEDAEPWLPAPAVGVTVAGQETSRLPSAVVQGQRHITEYQGSGEFLHAHEPRTASSRGQDRRSPSRSVPTSTARSPCHPKSSITGRRSRAKHEVERCREQFGKIVRNHVSYVGGTVLQDLNACITKGLIGGEHLIQ